MPRSCCYRIEYVAIILRMSSNKPVSACCYRIEYVAIILRIPTSHAEHLRGKFTSKCQCDGFSMPQCPRANRL